MSSENTSNKILEFLSERKKEAIESYGQEDLFITLHPADLRNLISETNAFKHQDSSIDSIIGMPIVQDINHPEGLVSIGLNANKCTTFKLRGENE